MATALARGAGIPAVVGDEKGDCCVERERKRVVLVNSGATRCVGGLVLSALLWAGCGASDTGSKDAASKSAGANATKRVRVCVSVQSTANSYSQAQITGAKQAASKLNASVEVLDPNWDARVQRNQIQDAAASHRCDAIVVNPLDGPVVAPGVKSAIAAGLAVTGMFAPIGPNNTTLQPQIDGVKSTVGPPLPQIGQILAEATIKACAQKNPCNVLFLGGVLTLASDKAELDGFKSSIAKAGNIRLTTRSAGDYLATNARKAMADIAQTMHSLNVVTTLGDQLATGVEQALNDSGVKGVAIIGNGGSEKGVQAVEAGRWFATSALYPRTEGRVATENAIQAFRGKHVPAAVNEFDLAPIKGAVTKANAGQFKPEWTQ